MDGGGDDGLGPIGGGGEVGGGGDFSLLHFEEEHRLGAVAFGGVGFRGVVVDTQVVDVGEEADEVLAAAGPAFADFFFGDVVSAVGHAAADAAEMEVGAGQPAKPHMQALAGAGGLIEELRDGASAESGFETVVALLGDGLLEEGFADLPRVSVGEGERNVGVEVVDLVGDGVGVEESVAFLEQKATGHAAFARAIDPGQYGDDG